MSRGWSKWWSKCRTILIAGIAIVLVSAASGGGCDSSSAATCPEMDSGAAVLGLLGAGATTQLAKSDLAEDLERARDIARMWPTPRTAPATGRRGYKVMVPMTDDEDDERIILVRVMARGGGRENYYRVSFPDKGVVDKDGEYSNKQEETHHEISDDAVSEILDLTIVSWYEVVFDGVTMFGFTDVDTNPWTVTELTEIFMSRLEGKTKYSFTLSDNDDALTIVCEDVRVTFLQKDVTPRSAAT